MINWFTKLYSFLSPSVVIGANGQVYADGATNIPTAGRGLTAAQRAALLAKSQVATASNPAPSYTPNPFTTAQLTRVPFQASPSMLQAYNSKMQGYGITPQPFVPSASAPVRGGK